VGELDDIAADQLEAERVVHESNLSRIPTTDRAALAGELDRHLNRTQEIMSGLRERMSGQ
jgi:hypothetical protein